MWTCVPSRLGKRRNSLNCFSRFILACHQIKNTLERCIAPLPWLFSHLKHWGIKRCFPCKIRAEKSSYVNPCMPLLYDSFVFKLLTRWSFINTIRECGGVHNCDIIHLRAWFLKTYFAVAYRLGVETPDSHCNKPEALKTPIVVGMHVGSISLPHPFLKVSGCWQVVRFMFALQACLDRCFCEGTFL